MTPLEGLIYMKHAKVTERLLRWCLECTGAGGSYGVAGLCGLCGGYRYKGWQSPRNPSQSTPAPAVICVFRVLPSSLVSPPQIYQSPRFSACGPFTLFSSAPPSPSLGEEGEFPLPLLAPAPSLTTLLGMH